MPHLTIEYTNNLGPGADIAGLLTKANRVLCAVRTEAGPVYPVGGIRSRALELSHFCVADGSADDAFVHATLKIGAGRSEAIKHETGAALFEMIKEHFAALYRERFLALSLELVEFSEQGTFKQNNIHARYKAP
jgi:5-carboxymethyl-2-hydroxymuconate isomerase